MPSISHFPTVKTAALYLVPIKRYSKNTYPPSFLKWAVDTFQNVSSTFIFFQKFSPGPLRDTWKKDFTRIIAFAIYLSSVLSFLVLLMTSNAHLKIRSLFSERMFSHR
jgi:hypothetical protein